MKYIFIGLGNPGKEYELTRHNMGRIMLDFFRKENGFDDFTFDKKINALSVTGQIGKDKVVLILPETFMNNSGKSLKALDLTSKDAERVCVIYDDLDLPFTGVKMSFNKSSGGHKGLESIIKALKTEKFYRIRVGISHKTATGKIKKPKGQEAVYKLIMKNFTDDEMKELKKLSKKINEALKIFVVEGYEKSASFLN
jgi:PTH1 family peptidyl-tRNA hydrolase